MDPWEVPGIPPLSVAALTWLLCPCDVVCHQVPSTPTHGNQRSLYNSARIRLSQPAGPETVHLGHAGGFGSEEVEQAAREKASMKILDRRTPTTAWPRVLLSQDPWYGFQALATHCALSWWPSSWTETQPRGRSASSYVLTIFLSLFAHLSLC